MIRISYNPSTLSMAADGHAGYAAQGKDIVCAGVSALIWAIPKAFDNLSTSYRLQQDEDKGHFRIETDVSGRYSAPRHQAWLVLESVYAGLENIAGEYPDYVSIERIEEV